MGGRAGRLTHPSRTDGGLTLSRSSADWIDSPAIGQGEPPAEGVDIYLSAYLDRLLKLDEVDYSFSATILPIASFSDPRAPAQITAATEEAHKLGGNCQRWCDNTYVPTNATRCCDDLFLPSLILRNVAEYPQGRPQATQITVTEEGIVTWRVMMRADLYTTVRDGGIPIPPSRERGMGIDDRGDWEREGGRESAKR